MVFIWGIIFLATNAFASESLLLAMLSRNYSLADRPISAGEKSAKILINEVDLSAAIKDVFSIKADFPVVTKKDAMGVVRIYGAYRTFRLEGLYALMEKICHTNKEYIMAYSPGKTIYWQKIEQEKNRVSFSAFLSTATPLRTSWDEGNKTPVSAGAQMILNF